MTMLLTQPRPNRRTMANASAAVIPASPAARRFVASAHCSTGSQATSPATSRGRNSR